MANSIPERLADFNAYDENEVLLGVATVEMPEITFLSDTISGAGIMGEMDSSIVGQTESMETSIEWRLLLDQSLKMLAPTGRKITFRGAQQLQDGDGVTRHVGLRVTMGVRPKGLTLGSLESNAATGTTSTFEVSYLSIYVGGKEKLTIDKLNSVFKVDGIDYYAPVKKLI